MKMMRKLKIKLLCKFGLAVDIHPNGMLPENELSNYYPHRFVFDGVECASMEGFLQSLKYKEPAKQIEICGLIGRAANDRGCENWILNQDLFWKGKQYNRHGWDYQVLLCKAYDAMCTQCKSFRQALKATVKKPLFYSLGEKDPRETVLTASEFIDMLNKLRDRLRAEDEVDLL